MIGCDGSQEKRKEWTKMLQQLSVGEVRVVDAASELSWALPHMQSVWNFFVGRNPIMVRYMLTCNSWKMPVFCGRKRNILCCIQKATCYLPPVYCIQQMPTFFFFFFFCHQAQACKSMEVVLTCGCVCFLSFYFLQNIHRKLIFFREIYPFNYNK